MANTNISDNTKLDGHVNLTEDKKLNWISQINAGGNVYDIATHHGITFRDGSGDKTGVTWNGLTDLEIIIPNISDLIQNPIDFVGTVGADGKIIRNDGKTDAAIGDLIFITADCTFEGHACEAGDMAIYDGTNWNIVSGENQVTITGTNNKDISDDNRTVVKVGATTDVLEVEGKALALELDYKDLNSHIQKDPGGNVSVVFSNKVSVKDLYLKLTKSDTTSDAIGEEKTITNATALKDGKVNFNVTNVITDVTFGEFEPGTQTTFDLNDKIDLDVTGGAIVSSSKQTTGDFIDGITLGATTFATATDGENGSIKVVSAISEEDGAAFLNGIHITDESDNEDVDITIPGYLTPETTDVEFVEGLKDGKAPIVGISEGGITLVSLGGDFDVVTGLSGESTTTGDFISDIEVGDDSKESVCSAEVNNHVLTLTPVDVVKSVSVSKKYKSLAKSGVKYIAPTAETGEFITSGFTKTDDINYTFDKGNVKTYTPTYNSWKINTADPTITWGSYDVSDISVSIPANSFVSSITPGELPSLGESIATPAAITGSVGTELTTKDEKFFALKTNTIQLPDFTLGVGTSEDNDVVVGASGQLDNPTAKVNLAGYIKDFSIVEEVANGEGSEE